MDRASMNRTSPRRSVRCFAPCGALSLAKNHRQAGICVVRNSCGGSAIMHATRSASTMAARISPSPDCWDDIEPLARTTPAEPRSASL